MASHLPVPLTPGVVSRGMQPQPVSCCHMPDVVRPGMDSVYRRLEVMLTSSLATCVLHIFPKPEGEAGPCVPAYGHPHSQPQPPPPLASSSAQPSLVPVLSSLTGCLLDTNHVFNSPSRRCTCNHTLHSVSPYSALLSFVLHVPLRVSSL